MSRFTPKFEYPGGVLDHERDLIEKFERDVLPFTEKYGSFIGQLAMSGHEISEEVILRHQGFMRGGPDQRPYNFRMLVRALKKWKREWESCKADSRKMIAPGTVH